MDDIETLLQNYMQAAKERAEVHGHRKAEQDAALVQAREEALTSARAAYREAMMVRTMERFAGWATVVRAG